MSIAAYNVRIRKSGDSTATTAEACTSLGSNVYQITTAARRCINPDVAFCFVDSGTTTVVPGGIASGQLEFGKITFVSAPSGAITFYGAYLPLTTSSEDVAEATDMNISMSKNLLDTTVMGMASRARIAGLRDVDVSMTLISSPTSYSALYASHVNGTRVCLEIDPDGASGSVEVFRGFARVESLERSGSVDGRVESAVSFKVDAAICVPPYSVNAGYSWG